MNLLNRLSIKNKLILTILAVTFITATLGFSIVIFSHISSLKKDLVSNLEMEARLTAEYCITPMTFNDEKGATDILKKLKSIPTIERAELYDNYNKQFAAYNSLTSQSKGLININKDVFSDSKLKEVFKISGNNIYYYYPIEYKNEKYGKIYLSASLKDYHDKIKEYFLLMSVLMVALIILAYLIASFLQKFISKPLLDLAEFTDKISLTYDYSLKLEERESSDEIGVLYKAFNSMLEQINNRQMERDLAEKALRQTENYNRILIEAIPDLIYIFDKQGRISYYKSKNFNYFSTNPELIIGKNVRELISTPRQLKLFNGFVELAFKTRDVQSCEYELKDSRGDSYYEERLIALNPEEILCIVRDITNQKVTTQQLAHEKVRAAAAEEADKLKSAFLANMSHEIRTPMNAIIGFSNLLKDTYTSQEEKEEYIDIINKSGENLMHLIDDIIDLSRIEAGQLVIKKKDCNINQAMTDLWSIFSKEIQFKHKQHITLDLIISDKDTQLVISTDEYRFRQVLTNLLSNAMKFTEHGSIQFGYQFANSSQPKADSRQQSADSTPNAVLFYVKDSGIGIPSDSISEIFERFKKIENKRVKLYGGAGLGLAICKNLVESLGGKIWVESIVGHGATFYFTLPLDRQSAISQQSAESVQTETNYNWEGKSILIAEDEELVCKFLERILLPTNASVIWAHDGNSAVDNCTSNDKIDIVLMDIKLPGLSGHEAVKKIKAIRPGLPIIAQTAFAMDEDREECLQSGCDDYVSKPIDSILLMQKMNKLLFK